MKIHETTQAINQSKSTIFIYGVIRVKIIHVIDDSVLPWIYVFPLHLTYVNAKEPLKIPVTVRSRKSKKYRQCNVHKQNDKQMSTNYYVEH